MSILERTTYADDDVKAGYWLFKPTPDEEMRELATDRPDTLENPRSLDAGHFQMELDFASLSLEQGVHEASLGNMNLKLGLTNRMDLQVVFSSLLHNAGGVGFGDIAIRTKYNLMGNDSEGVALAVMPFVSFPTASSGFSSGKVEGGLIVPLSFELGYGFDAGVMLQSDLVWVDTAYKLDWLSVASFGHDLVGPVSCFVEVVVEYVWASPTERVIPVRTNGGLILAASENLNLDLGVQKGITESADDIRIFIGGSWRK